MKKILISVISLFFIVGCACSMKLDASDAAKNYLNQYKNHDEEILKELDTYVLKEDLTSDQRETYKNILKKQYKDLKYEITDEKYDGNKATVTANITVYDLYKSQKDSDNYLIDHRNEFNDSEGVYSITKYLEYKLEKMFKQEETITYSIKLNLEKDSNDNWQVTNISETDLQKIHGIYNYD